MNHSLSSESSREKEIGKPFTAFRVVLSAWVHLSSFFGPRYHPYSGIRVCSHRTTFGPILIARLVLLPFRNALVHHVDREITGKLRDFY